MQNTTNIVETYLYGLRPKNVGDFYLGMVKMFTMLYTA